MSTTSCIVVQRITHLLAFARTVGCLLLLRVSEGAELGACDLACVSSCTPPQPPQRSPLTTNRRYPGCRWSPPSCKSWPWALPIPSPFCPRRSNLHPPNPSLLLLKHWPPSLQSSPTLPAKNLPSSSDSRPSALTCHGCRAMCVHCPLFPPHFTSLTLCRCASPNCCCLPPRSDAFVPFSTLPPACPTALPSRPRST